MEDGDGGWRMGMEGTNSFIFFSPKLQITQPSPRCRESCPDPQSHSAAFPRRFVL